MKVEFLVIFVVLFTESFCHFNNNVHLIPAHIICPNVTKNHDILLPDPNDCSVYYQCVNGSAVPKNCPPGLEWCEILSECTLPIIANCSIGHQVVTYSDEDLKTYSPATPGTTGPTIINICPVDGGQIPDPLNCQQYYVCKNERPVLTSCPSGEAYSCWDAKCETADSADCVGKPQNGKNCTNNGEKLPHAKNCTKYYICINHTVETRSCPDHKEFNPWFKKCYPRRLAHCPSRHGNCSETSNHTCVPPKDPSIIENICPFDGGLLPNVLNCSQYYECQNELPVLKDCPPGEVYSCWDAKCEFSNTADCINNGPQDGKNCSRNHERLPHPSDCGKYYECENHKIVTKSCPPGEQFNPWFKKCYPSDLAYCQTNSENTTTTTESTTSTATSPPNPLCPIDGLYYPTTNDCSAYYVCKNRQLVKIKCTPGLNYNCETKQCENITHCCASNPPVSTTPTTTPEPSHPGGPTTRPEPSHPGGSTTTPEPSHPGGSTTTPEPSHPGGSTTTPEPSHPSNNTGGHTTTPEPSHPSNNTGGHTTTPEPSHPGGPTTTPEPSHPGGSTTTPEASHPSNNTGGHTTTPEPSHPGGPTTTPEPSHPGGSTTTPEPSHPSNNTGGHTTTPEPSHPSHNTGGHTTTPEPSHPGGPTTTTSSDTGPTSFLCPKDGIQYPTTTDCNAYYICKDHRLVKVYCPKGLNYNCETKKCENITHCCATTPTPKPITTLKPTTDCVEGSLLPNPLNCSKYYKCVNDKFISEDCALNYQYSCWDMRCVPSSGANCVADGSQTGKNCSLNGQRVQNIENCYSYYECDDGTVELKSCPANTYYNPSVSECSPVTNSSQCETYPTVSVPPPVTTPSPEKSNDICPVEGGLLPDPLNCTGYYRCENQRPVHYFCPNSEAYSCWDQKCIPATESKSGCISGDQEKRNCSKDGERLQDTEDCHSYYECVLGEVRKNKCPDGKQYNKWFAECVSAPYAHCQSDTNTTEKPTPTPSSTYDICPVEGALLPNPVDCSTYYQCKNETPVLKKCPDGDEYSCWDQMCVPAKSAECIVTGIPEKNCREGARLPDIENCNGYYECDNGKVILRRCKEHEEYNQWFQKCMAPEYAHCETQATQTTAKSSQPITKATPNPDNDVCPVEGGLLPDPSDCSKYYKCISGNPVIQSCAQNYEYSCWQQECVPASKSECISYGNQTGKTCYKNGQKNQNPNDCHSYYECVNGVVELKTCIAGWFYNRWFGICIFFKSSHCKTYTTLSPPITHTTPPPSTNDICPINGALLPNPLNCSSYYVCRNHLATVQYCPSGQGYSCWDQSCLPGSQVDCIAEGQQVGRTCAKEGEKLQDPANCYSYYQCVKGKVQRKYCFIGFQYNKWYQNCELALFSHCTTYPTYPPSTKPPPHSPDPIYNICPVEGGLLPNPVDCTSYYVCRNETPKLEKCPSGYEYSCWDQKCENDTDANCISDGIQLGQNCSKEGERLPNIQDCSTYYECVKGVAVVKKCEGKKEYNEWFKKCVYSNVSHCQTYSTKSPTQKPTTNSTGTPDPDNDVCPVDGGLLPDPNNCTTYYKCINGTPTLQTCANGLAYSCWEQKCISASQANCFAANNQTGQKCKYDGQKIQNLENCHTYYQCVKGKVQLKTCILNWYYNKWFGFCIPIFKSAHCKPGKPITPPPTPKPTPPPSPSLDICPVDGGLLPDPLDCSSYYICKGSKPIHQNCPKKQMYSCWDQKCVPDGQGQCLGKGDPEGSNCSKEGERLQDTSSCTSFYECTNGKVQKNYCSLHKKYNKWYQYCTNESLSHCETYSTSTSTPTSTITGSTPSTSVVCPTDKAKVPNPTNCSTYFICNHGTPTLEVCPPGTAYDCWNDKCESLSIARCVNVPTAYVGQKCKKNGQTIPKISDCNCYYLCQNGVIVEKSCPFLTQYSVWGNKCMFALFAKCANNKFLGII